MKLSVVLLTFLFSLLLISCSSCKHTNSTVKNVSYNDEKIEARIGDTINISLDYPPTAGFEWELKSFDKEFCNLSDNKSHIKIDNSNMYRNIWSFVCLKSGNTVIDYTFLRGLNKGKGFGNDETKSFNIVITE